MEDIKRDFDSVKQATESLSQEAIQQSVRVGKYAELLFTAICVADIYPDDPTVRAITNVEDKDIVLEAGKFLEIGKAFFPELYRSLRADFTEEELNLYKTYPEIGADFLRKIYEKESTYTKREQELIFSSLANQEEKWNGTGFPLGLKEGKIPVLGRLMAVAKELDSLASKKLSEKPFEFALNEISSKSGTLYDPEIIRVLLENKTKLKRIFSTYITQTQAIPATENMISRRGKSPLKLMVKPIFSPKNHKVIASECKLMYAYDKKLVDLNEVSHILSTQAINYKMGIYMLMQVTDFMRRIDACKIPLERFMVIPHKSLLTNRALIRDLTGIIKDSEIEIGRLGLILTREIWENQTITMQDNLKKLSDLGVRIVVVCDSKEELFNLNEGVYNGVRLSESFGRILSDKDITDRLLSLTKNEKTIIADGIEKKSHMALFSRNKIIAYSSNIAGGFISEDDFINCELDLLEN